MITHPQGKTGVHPNDSINPKATVLDILMHQVQDNFGSFLFTLPLNGFAHAKHTQKKTFSFANT